MGDAISDFFSRHPDLKSFIDKVMKDNIGMLASVVAWTLLTSIVPIVVGLVGISALFLRDKGTQDQVTNHLSAALQGVLSARDIQSFVGLTVQHRGLLTVIGLLGILWGGANVGGSISTVFQPIFQVRGRDFIPEKLLDIAMIFVFTVLMLLIILGTSSVSLVDQLLGRRIPGMVTYGLGIATSLLAAFLLFAIIYLVFPNTAPRFKWRSVWPGAAIASVLFEILSFIWPLYASTLHFKRYGAVVGAIIVLGAWIYFFALILMIGAEFVSFRALKEARAEGRQIGPQPDGNVPQRMDGAPPQMDRPAV